VTRRHFELIAAAIRDGRERFASNGAHARFAREMADALAATNGRFDRGRFVMAAMPSAWVGTRHAAAWERIADGAGS
jgi:hypothetical protein